MKNFKWHEGRSIQFRFETYNSFDHTSLAARMETRTTIDTVARFDATGKRVNQRFGQYFASRDGCRVQPGVKFAF